MATSERILYFCDKKRHLVCYPYSIENLHIMANKLGIKNCWFHYGKHPHYDIPKRRILEITEKCIVVDSQLIVNITKNRFFRIEQK